MYTPSKSQPTEQGMKGTTCMISYLKNIEVKIHIADSQISDPICDYLAS